MEGLSPEIEDALQEMNWEDRLKHARAQREAVLKARAEEGGVTGRMASGQKIDAGDLAARLRFGESEQVFQQNADPDETISSRMPKIAYLSVGFCAGLCIGAAMMAFGSQFLGGEPLTQTRTPGAPLPGTALSAATAPTAQVPETVDVSQVAPSAPVVLSDRPIGSAAPLALGRSTLGESAPALRSASVERRYPVPPRMEARPTIGTPLPQSVFEVEDSIGAHAFAPLANPIDLASSDFATPAHGIRNIQFVSAYRHLPAAAHRDDPGGLTLTRPADATSPVGAVRLAVFAPERPALMASFASDINATDLTESTARDLVAVSLRDDVPVPSSSPSTVATAPRADSDITTDTEPPAPMIPGAKDMRVWIFAPATVDEALLNSTLQSLADYGLSVREVYTIDYGISETQVRFYHNTSASAAKRLAAELGAVARDFTTLETDLQPGGLEVYLAGRSSRAAPQRSAPRPAPPAPEPAEETVELSQPIEADDSRNRFINRLLNQVFR